MTPLQVIMLGYEMRQAQKAVQASLKGETPLMDRYNVMVGLENQFDTAIEAYVNYYRSVELQEERE